MWKIIKKQKRTTTTVICHNCGKSFEKAVTEVNRTKKRNGKHYCSLSCCGYGNKHNFGEKYGKGDVSLFSGKTRVDEFTGFRDFIRRAKQRDKLGDLSLEDLKDQWNDQDGFCPYTGISLKLPKARKKQELFEMASLDRIDSSKPYEKGNVKFVAAPINYMKNSMSEEETIKYCKIIAEFWG